MDYTIILMPIITLLTANITGLDLGQFRLAYKKLFIVLALELILQSIICGFILFFYGYEQYAKWFLFIVDFPVILTFFYLSKRRDFRDLFTILVVLFLNFTISVPSMWLSQLFGNRYLSYNLFRIIIFALLFYFLHTKIRIRYLQIQEEIEKGWGIYSIIPFMGCLRLFVKYREYSKNGDFSEVVVQCVVVIFLLAAVFMLINYVLEQLHLKYLIQEQKRILALQNKAQQEQLEQLKEEAQRTNRIWHDTRHYIQEMIELLEAGNTEAALTYLKKKRGMDVVPNKMYCLHPAVNSILCLWAERSRKANILVEIQTDIPDKLDIEPTELSALFANAFENAYNGCLCLPGDDKKFIKVEANYNGKRLGIGFTNPCRKDIHFEKDMPLSTRKGGGIGTRSIVYTVRRFQGTAYFGVEEGLFIARFVLNI